MRIHFWLWNTCIVLAVLSLCQLTHGQAIPVKVDRASKSNPRYLKLIPAPETIDPKISELAKCCLPVHLDGTEWFDRWWSWPLWWELNVQHHLHPKTDLQVTDSDAGAAQTALLHVLENNHNPKVLAQVIYALGRMQCKDATALIIKKLKHSNDDVRHMSWVALGLIEDDLAMQTFLDVLKEPKLEDEDTSYWIIGIGLMHKPDEALLKALIPIITQVNLLRINAGEADAHRNEAMPQARIAMWAMRMHNPKGINKLALEVLDISTDPLLFDECIQALANNLNEELTTKILHPLYHRRPIGWQTMPAKAMAYSSFIYETPMAEVLTNDDSHQQLAAMRTSIAIAYDDMMHSAKDRDKRLIKLINRQIKRTYTILIDTNPDSQAGKPSLRHIKRHYFKYDHWHHTGGFCMCEPDVLGYATRYAMIPLGRFGDIELKGDKEEPADAEFLCDVLKKRYTLKKGQSEHDPKRAFAALGLGLYLQRLPNDTTQIREDKLRKMARYIDRLLTRVASDPDEPENLRAAAGVGIGVGLAA